MQVPNQYAPEKVFQRFLKNIKLKKDKWDLWRTPDHLFEPHIEPMRRVLSENGFVIRDYETYSRKDLCNSKSSSKLRHTVLKIGTNLRIIFQKEADS